MRTRLLLFAIVSSAGALSTSYGALYTVNNGSTDTSNGIASSGLFSDPSAVPAIGTFTGFQSPGNPGILGLGIFTISDAQITGATNLFSLLSAFSQFGAEGTFNSAGPTGFKGLFSRATNDTVNATSFDTKNIYVFAGNGTTFANSTELLILKTNTLFDAAQDGSPTPIVTTITTANTTLLFGRNLADVKTTSLDASVTPGWGTATAIPEPSSLMLVSIGALALLRRRR
jgi:hypothetical protein